MSSKQLVLTGHVNTHGKEDAYCMVFITILFFQLTKIPFPVLGIMILAIINGLITSIILETNNSYETKF